MCVAYRKPKSLKISIIIYLTTDLFAKKTNQKDYENGFLIYARLEQHINKVWKLNDRISILEIQMKLQHVCTQNGKAKITVS